MSEQPFIPAVGGDVQASGGTYIRRSADEQLLQACLNNEFAYVLASRQIGKSSLKNAVAERLIAQGVRVARIDLNRIGQEGVSAKKWHFGLFDKITHNLGLGIDIQPSEKWYFGLVDEIARTLGLDIEVEEWWSNQRRSTLTQRFVRFFDKVVLAEIRQPIVIFIDEIDVTLDLPFTNDLFAIIRSLHNDRAQNPNYRRLTFVLLGVASPDELINDPKRTPFNVGKAIEIRDFQWEECEPLRLFIEATHPDKGKNYFKQIYEWTNGHPYLTQKLCFTVAKTSPANNPKLVDDLVNEIFFKEGERIEDNLHFVQTRVLQDRYTVQMLQTYAKILHHHSVRDDKKSPAINRLSLYGLVVANNGVLHVRNKLYEKAFDSEWCRENNPRNWNQLIAYIAVFLTVFVSGAFSGIYLYNRNIDNVDRDTNLHFYRTHDPKERIEALATLFTLKYFYFETRNFANEARDLFFGLPAKEQFDLFQASTDKSDDKIVIVIQGLYTALADVSNSGRSTPLLQAMADALHRLAKTEEKSKLVSEIDYWVEGRNSSQQGQDQQALDAYRQAIDLNGNNLSTLYERARVYIELAQYTQALADLDQIVFAVKQSSESMPTEQVIERIFTSTPTSSSTDTPTHSSTSIPFLTVTPFSIPASIPTALSELLSSNKPLSTPGLLTNVPTPTTTSAPTAGGPEFATSAQIINAIRSLINGDSGLVNFARGSKQQDYPSLLEFQLLPTPQVIALTAVPPTITLHTEASTTMVINTPTPTQIPRPSNLITYFTQARDKKSLHVLNPDGTSTALIEGVADVIILDVSPDRHYLALAVSSEGKISTDGRNLRFLTGTGIRLIVISSDGHQVKDVLSQVDGFDAAYNANGDLFIAILKSGSEPYRTVNYAIAKMDGSELREFYSSRNYFPPTPTPTGTPTVMS